MRWGIFDEFSPKSSTFLNADYLQENVRCSRSRESFMYAPAKSNYFCSKNSGQKRSSLHIEHYNLPPTLQNEHCDRKSTWEEQGSEFFGPKIKTLPFLNRYRRELETCPQAKTSKSGHAIFFSFFPTRPSDEYDSAPSRKYSRPLLDVFACIG